ncbi:SOUL heme-binding protein [Symmachiella macrocystis]|uniref:SOUL heme-binding protein n=1 Tax=Symmachiella macrocystis TaxID=2527985 RepID=A0A5C6BRE1_9PLAN|nr:heme-binding protein [Symmachiella macrocystis]TWU13244.1 SOUL heme-binding protein [Symmachiella macrocystis]
MSWKKVIYACLTTFLVTVAYFGWRLTARSAYETAKYTVIEVDGSFETRSYPDLMLATTNMKVQPEDDDGSFMRLFQYISGANDNDQKVAMTTPVFMESQNADSPGQMGFVLPKDVSEVRVPEPSDEEVEIEKRAGGKFAVVRFAGRMNSETVAKAKKDLQQWMDSRGFVAEGAPELAGYDPPWTPGPLRRNEILIRLQ